jgi:hypothetical protein
MAIWRDLVDDHGFTARDASVPHFVVMLRGTAAPEARVVIITAAREEAHVDYGEPSAAQPRCTADASSRFRRALPASHSKLRNSSPQVPVHGLVHKAQSDERTAFRITPNVPLACCSTFTECALRSQSSVPARRG